MWVIDRRILSEKDILPIKNASWDAAEPFLKRPLELEARELFEIYMSNFIEDWVEIPNHHKVPVPTKPSELLHSTYHLVKTNKWKPPTSPSSQRTTRDTDGIARNTRNTTLAFYISWRQP